MRENIGLNFAAALRSFLRQDPNIILVGEIRDFETAEIAVKAALTGHLVLSTLHTNDAPEHDQPSDEHGHRAVPGGQLAEPGVRQRLVRRVCSNCKAGRVPPQALEQIGFSAEDAAASVKPCGSGLRLQLHGLQGSRRIIRSDGSPTSCGTDPRRRVGAGAAAQGDRGGMITLRGSGLQKVSDGVTSIEEVLRETVSRENNDADAERAQITT